MEGTSNLWGREDARGTARIMDTVDGSEPMGMENQDFPGTGECWNVKRMLEVEVIPLQSQMKICSMKA